MAIATVADVEARYNHELTDDERRVVETRLEDAERIIRTRVPDLDERISTGALSSDVVAMVEADTVLRLIRNPEGVRQETDGNYSYSINAQVASGWLELLPREWALLGVRSGVYTIDPTPKMPWEA